MPCFGEIFLVLRQAYALNLLDFGQTPRFGEIFLVLRQAYCLKSPRFRTNSLFWGDFIGIKASLLFEISSISDKHPVLGRFR